MGRAIAVLALVTGCNVEIEIGRECPQGEACSPLRDTAAGAHAAAGLTLHIEADGIAVSRVDIGCERPCFHVTAVAQGGQPPYRVLWDDGFDQPTRLLCPGITTRYSVGVSDASMSAEAGSASEFTPTATMVAHTEFDAVVTPCSHPEPAPQGPPPVADPSVTAPVDCAKLHWQRPPPEQAAMCAPSIWRLLSRPVFAGRMHAFLARGQGLWVGSWRVELWGSPNGCALTERLGEFSVDQGRVNQSVSFVPMRDHRMVVLTVDPEVNSDGKPYLGYSLCSPEVP